MKRLLLYSSLLQGATSGIRNDPLSDLISDRIMYHASPFVHRLFENVLAMGTSYCFKTQIIDKMDVDDDYKFAINYFAAPYIKLSQSLIGDYFSSVNETFKYYSKRILSSYISSEVQNAFDAIGIPNEDFDNFLFHLLNYRILTKH